MSPSPEQFRQWERMKGVDKQIDSMFGRITRRVAAACGGDRLVGLLVDLVPSPDGLPGKIIHPVMERDGKRVVLADEGWKREFVMTEDSSYTAVLDISWDEEYDPVKRYSIQAKPELFRLVGNEDIGLDRHCDGIYVSNLTQETKYELSSIDGIKEVETSLRKGLEASFGGPLPEVKKKASRLLEAN